MTIGAIEMILWFVFDASISMYDMEIERRPYHRNCGCALHKLKGVGHPNACSVHKNVLFLKKKSWNECSLSQAAASKSPRTTFLGDLSVRNIEDADEALSSR